MFYPLTGGGGCHGYIQTARLKRVNFTVGEWHLNKPDFKKEKENNSSFNTKHKSGIIKYFLLVMPGLQLKSGRWGGGGIRWEKMEATCLPGQIQRKEPNNHLILISRNLSYIVTQAQCGIIFNYKKLEATSVHQ